MSERPIRFGVVGIDHGHIHAQIEHMVDAGASFASFFAEDDALAVPFQATYDTVPRARSESEILEDSSIDLVLSASIPSERAPLGVRVMEHGKDFLVDKPGFTTLEQLAAAEAVQRATGRIYSVFFSEHFAVPSVVRAGELVAAGAIGRVIQTIGLGPHKTNLASRPAWFFDRSRYGGILNDIGSHQVEQFLFFTGSSAAQVVCSQVANYAHPEHPGLEDWGEMSLVGDGGHGYVRVDWYTPRGIEVFGDGRLFILGTEGYIELRKYVDPGVGGGDLIVLADHDGVRRIDGSSARMPYGPCLLRDVRERTETAIPMARVFLASRLALEAEAAATRLGNLA